MAQTDPEITDGWEPVSGVEPLAERIDFDTLDFVPELAHPLRARILRQLKRPQSIAEVAATLAVPVTRLYHHVNRLEDAGLIQVVATRKVAAVIERQYQVIARTMGVALEVFESEDPVEVATALGPIFDMAKLGLQREIESGALRLDETNNNTVLSFGHVTLSPERATELTDRLEALIAEFSSDAQPTDQAGGPVALLIAAYPESD